MKEIKQRLQYIAKYKGMSVRAFETYCKLNRGVISNMDPNGSIGSDKLSKIIDAIPELSTDWLLTGQGNMLRNYDVPSSSETADGIPLIPVEAMAGYLSGEVSVSDSDCERLNIPGLKADFVIPVSGDSMEPKYYSGDFVACQNVSLNDVFFQWGKVYVIDTNQGVLLKKVKKGNDSDNILLISENPEYDPITMPREDIYHIALVKGLVRII